MTAPRSIHGYFICRIVSDVLLLVLDLGKDIREVGTLYLRLSSLNHHCASLISCCAAGIPRAIMLMWRQDDFHMISFLYTWLFVLYNFYITIYRNHTTFTSTGHVFQIYTLYIHSLLQKLRSDIFEGKSLRIQLKPVQSRH